MSCYFGLIWNFRIYGSLFQGLWWNGTNIDYIVFIFIPVVFLSVTFANHKTLGHVHRNVTYILFLFWMFEEIFCQLRNWSIFYIKHSEYILVIDCKIASQINPHTLIILSMNSTAQNLGLFIINLLCVKVIFGCTVRLCQQNFQFWSFHIITVTHLSHLLKFGSDFWVCKFFYR